MSAATVRVVEDVAAYRAAVEPWLLRDEAAHGLMLGLLPGIAAGAYERPLLALVEREGEPALAALRTPPHDLILSGADRPDAASALAEALAGHPAAADVAGVLAPTDAADAFAAAWTAARGGRARVLMRNRVYRLDRLEARPEAPGAPRRATADDLALLSAWLGAFQAEALPEEPSDAEAAAHRWLEAPGREVWLWEDGGAPVCMVGAGSPTREGARIGAVYTPPERRGRGYASALVAHVSAALLAAGRRFCTLYTDLDNPTSNRLYRRIGYRPVVDVRHLRFEPAGSGDPQDGGA
jgi:predicted GNAT family acetyltransferase